MTKARNIYSILFPSVDVFFVVFAATNIVATKNNCLLQKDSATLTQRLQCCKSEGTKWLLNERNTDWGWGSRGEAQSIIALHLSSDHLLNKSDPYVYISVKEMNIDLLKALSHDTNLASSNWGHGVLGIYVTALIATCQDPHDFYGFDLLDKLQAHVENFTEYYKSNKFAYSWALIGICMAGGPIQDRYKDHLVTQFGNTSLNLDTASMILMALSCERSDRKYDSYIQNLASSISQKQLPDGSFGNEYTTGLVVQALLSSNNSQMSQIVDKALFNLAKSVEQSSYTFRDVLAAAEVLPALSRTSYIETTCAINKVPDPVSTPKPNGKVLFVQITVENDVDSYGVYSKTWNTTSSPGRNLFQILERLNKEDTTFSKQEEQTLANRPRKITLGSYYHFLSITLTYQRSTFGVMIDTVNGLYADPNQHMYWSVLEYPNKPLTIGISNVVPHDGDQYVLRLTKW